MLLRASRSEELVLPIQMGETGDLTTSLVRFLMSSSDFPLRASCSLEKRAFALRCVGV